jgi:eukaryotic-like serine/threonine-protein kinase
VQPGPGSGIGIDAATWRRLNPLLDAALDLPLHERDAWLAALPAEHAGLREPLRELLASAARVEHAALLEALPALETTDPATAPNHTHTAGQLVGPYRLLHELGTGGMGVVWLAERADGLMAQRQVALKLPYGSLWQFGGDLALRIAREREILATLDHPHIARLYDAGVAPGGQAYLALEHVNGQRIDVYCQQQHLRVRARLLLFLQAARAVAHAHAQLVVHRDIKPSNLLVGADGQVKLLDFGIARLLEEGPLPASDATQMGQRALTPDYAAPEQIAGQPVGTRSDVYALGVLLFELLTGRRPYRLKRDSRAALEEAILAAEVPRPSEMATDPGLRKALRGDLDTIVLKALKKPVAERYASVDALVQDIERHLSNRPVLAQPDSAAYRLRKFITRNRLPVGAAAVLLLTVLGGAGAALWQARIAIAERQRAEDVKEFVAAIFREASPYDGSGKQQLTAVDLLKQADKKLVSTLAGQPAVRIELSNMIGESLIALGDIEAAEPVVARAVAEAASALAPAELQALRGLMLQSQIHRLRGRPQQARDDLDRVLPALRMQSTQRPAEFATALAHRTLTAIDLGAYPDAEKFALEGVQFTSAHFAERDALRVTAAVLLPLAYRYNKKFDLARASGERAVQLAVAAHGDKPPHLRVIEARGVYGRALADTGELARGIAMLEVAAADTRALLGPKSLQAAIFVQNMVDYRLEAGDLEAAAANATEALVTISETYTPDSMSYAIALHSRATAQLALQQGAAALADATRAAGVIDKLVGPGHEVSVAAHSTAALAAALEGQLGAALLSAEQTAPHAAKLPPANVQRARAARIHGTVLRLKGDAAAALPVLQAVTESTDPAPKWQRERMRALAQLGWAQLEQGAVAQAVASFERALKEFERLEARPTPARADAQLGLERARAQAARGG